jgi:hypothetical protein
MLSRERPPTLIAKRIRPEGDSPLARFSRRKFSPTLFDDVASSKDILSGLRSFQLGRVVCFLRSG